MTNEPVVKVEFGGTFFSCRSDFALYVLKIFYLAFIFFNIIRYDKLHLYVKIYG